MRQFSTVKEALIELYDHSVNYPQNLEDGPGIRLARYDSNPVSSLYRATTNPKGITDKQLELTIKLVTKYRKQWAKLGFDVSNINTDTTVDMPIRTDVDRSRTISVDNNIIIAKFPYIPKIISIFYNQSTERSCGDIKFIKDKQRWEVAATTGNILWLNNIAEYSKFERSEEFEDLVSHINNDVYDYNSICLDINDGELILRDAPLSMTDWIHKHIGDICMDNFQQIVQCANNLAFTVSRTVKEKIYKEHIDIADIMLQKETYINSNRVAIETVFEKLNQLGENIVVIDAPRESFSSLDVEKYMPDYNLIIYDKNDHNISIDPDKKNIILTTSAIPVVPDIIVSFFGFMSGPYKRGWFNMSKKVIYYCNDVDKKIKRAIRENESNSSYKG